MNEQLEELTSDLTLCDCLSGASIVITTTGIMSGFPEMCCIIE